ncbi:hypothetical protein PILCRDRAFT_707498 [Piloderma croceum F 1598]|uniref:Uncharacterized protein n=1 Tax=Piloderma croceum (strain F 1598) TaxID=765440 RepID=A0A0C3F2P1_PILCF|nr:hypothetical protein PILCRDRAFT_707498 [Piloderma croceum F 1598]
MSGSSYALQTSRQRGPPPPLRFQTSSRPASIIHGDKNSQTLLYDLPSATLIPSPAASPSTKSGLASPTSASHPGRSRTPRNARPTPPPSSRNRSTTPLGVANTDLEKFADHCRLWYFSQDEAAGRQMTQTLANLPPSERAPFSRLQASIRSAFHASINARRHAEFQAHISATQPGGSLMPHSRADPGGTMAQKERFERFDRFIRTWCTAGMPGTKPFFEGLWAVMRLQVIPEQLGGAGGNKIEWEFDDAVFKEAAGKDFMLEAIDILKGVLAFEEFSSTKTTPISTTSTTFPTLTPAHARATSQPLLSSSSKPSRIASTLHANRPRAPSDPFIDNPSPVTPSRPSGQTSQATGSTLAPAESIEEPPSPIMGPAGDEDELLATPRTNAPFDDSDGEYMRTWTSPDLPNPEFISLLKAFPIFITRRPLPRFPVASYPRRSPDIEEGEDDQVEGKEIRFGTGSMWVSSKQRSDGFEGGWWTRFVLWWRRLFC